MSQSHCSLAQQMNNGPTTAWEVHEFFSSSSSCLSFAFRVEKQCETRKTNDSVGCWLMRLEHTMWLLSLSINRSYELPETVWIYYFMLFAQDFLLQLLSCLSFVLSLLFVWLRNVMMFLCALYGAVAAKWRIICIGNCGRFWWFCH